MLCPVLCGHRRTSGLHIIRNSRSVGIDTLFLHLRKNIFIVKQKDVLSKLGEGAYTLIIASGDIVETRWMKVTKTIHVQIWSTKQ